jgi:YhgE/Pip-like protein
VTADSPSPTRQTSADPFPVRAGHLLRVRAVWVIPLVLGATLVAAITAFYLGSVVDPVAHLHDLPVALVNLDRGASVGGQHINVGDGVQAGLTGSPQVTSRLRVQRSDLPAADQAMGRGQAYATVIIPPGFTAALLNVSGAQPPAQNGLPTIQILTNQRAGGVGVGLATGILQPALDSASQQIGRQLTAQRSTGAGNGSGAYLANPIIVKSVPYRPLPSHSALGLSAFYFALLTLITGFLLATIVNSSVDGATGYAATEIGPRWRQRPPLPISRWQTLITKWAMAGVLTAVSSAILVAVAAALRLDMPDPALLWLYTWLCSASVAAGTLVLFSALGAPGQLVALLVFIYAGLASAGGTVPIQALPDALRSLSQVEPLRQILSGTRAILYFNAQADAGLRRGTVAAALGLMFWLIAGTVIVRWYDRRGLHRLRPETPAPGGRDRPPSPSEQTGGQPSSTPLPTPRSSTADGHDAAVTSPGPMVAPGSDPGLAAGNHPRSARP